MNEATPELSAEETARRGEEIYENLSERVEVDHTGEFLVIDVHSGKYELSPDEAEAFNRAIQNYPEGFFYIKRVGSRAAHRIG